MLLVFSTTQNTNIMAQQDDDFFNTTVPTSIVIRNNNNMAPYLDHEDNLSHMHFTASIPGLGYAMDRAILLDEQLCFSPTKKGYTPFHLAVFAKNIAAIDKFLEFPKIVSSILHDSDNGNTALHSAVIFFRGEEVLGRIVEFVIKNTENPVNAFLNQNKKGESVIDIIISFSQIDILNKNIEFFKPIVANHYSPQVLYALGLEDGEANFNEDTIEINLGENTETLLHLAARANNVKYLRDSNRILGDEKLRSFMLTETEEYMLPAAFAVYCGNVDFVREVFELFRGREKVLLEKTSKFAIELKLLTIGGLITHSVKLPYPTLVNHRPFNKIKESPIIQSPYNRKDDDEIINHETSLVEIAVFYQHSELLREMLNNLSSEEASYAVNIRNSKGQTPIHYCLSNGDLESLEIISEACGDHFKDILLKSQESDEALLQSLAYCKDDVSAIRAYDLIHSAVGDSICYLLTEVSSLGFQPLLVFLLCNKSNLFKHILEKNEDIAFDLLMQHKDTKNLFTTALDLASIFDIVKDFAINHFTPEQVGKILLFENGLFSFAYKRQELLEYKEPPIEGSPESYIRKHNLLQSILALEDFYIKGVGPETQESLQQKYNDILDDRNEAFALQKFFSDIMQNDEINDDLYKSLPSGQSMDLDEE